MNEHLFSLEGLCAPDHEPKVTVKLEDETPRHAQEDESCAQVAAFLRRTTILMPAFGRKVTCGSSSTRWSGTNSKVTC